MPSELILPLCKILFSIVLLILGAQNTFHLILACIFMAALLSKRPKTTQKNVIERPGSRQRIPLIQVVKKMDKCVSQMTFNGVLCVVKDL